MVKLFFNDSSGVMLVQAQRMERAASVARASIERVRASIEICERGL